MRDEGRNDTMRDTPRHVSPVRHYNGKGHSLLAVLCLAMLICSAADAQQGRRGGKKPAEPVKTSLDDATEIAVKNLEATAPTWVKQIGVWVLPPPANTGIYTPGLLENFSFFLTNSGRFTFVDVNDLFEKLGITPDDILKVGSLRKLSKRAGIEAVLYGKVVDTFGQHSDLKEDYYTTFIFKLTNTETAQILWARKVQGKNRTAIGKLAGKGRPGGKYPQDKYETFSTNLVSALRTAVDGPLRGRKRVGLMDVVNDSDVPVDGDRLMNEIEITLAGAEKLPGEPLSRMFDLVDRDVLIEEMPPEERIEAQLSTMKSQLAVRYHIDAFLFTVVPKHLHSSQDHLIASVRAIDPSTGISLWSQRIIGQDEGMPSAPGKKTVAERSSKQDLWLYLREDISR